MTKLQLKIFQFICTYLDRHGYSPSYKEIATGIHLSPKSISLISRSVHSLIKAGHLMAQGSGYRNIHLPSINTHTLPLIGKIAAGVPLEAFEKPESVELNFLKNNKEYFLLKVVGESMIDEGIQNGDFVICKSAQQAKEGDVVVALIDNSDATLKHLSYQVQDRITLIPANRNMKPKAYLPHRVQIQGVFMGILRLQDLPT